MNILLAYSEHTSRELAVALNEWLPRVLPDCEFQLCEPDVNGACERAGGHLATCICVTPEALQSPGIFYQAGAAYPNSPNGIAVPVVLDLEPEDLGDTPLTVFQATRADRQGLLALATTLNEMAAMPLTEQKLLESFDLLWNDCDDRLRSIPGTVQKQIKVTVATDSFLKTFPYSSGGEDGLLADTLIRMLEAYAQPGSPIAFPQLDYTAMRLFDVEHERWMETPKLLSRIRSTHIAFIDSSATKVLSDSLWLMAATIRARAVAGGSVAQDPLGGGFFVAS